MSPRTELIATIPKISTRSAVSLGLRVFQIPIPVQPINIFQAWHPRFDADPAHRFVRGGIAVRPRRFQGGNFRCIIVKGV